mmetsp:Transcript_15880/g.30715  ORF Transcript_15880/g.30715 Transcript_15880/m.30715 type:complete len:221 (-) Transcript_15880:757-1419(-)
MPQMKCTKIRPQRVANNNVRRRNVLDNLFLSFFKGQFSFVKVLLFNTTHMGEQVYDFILIRGLNVVIEDNLMVKLCGLVTLTHRLAFDQTNTSQDRDRLHVLFGALWPAENHLTIQAKQSGTLTVAVLLIVIAIHILSTLDHSLNPRFLIELLKKRFVVAFVARAGRSKLHKTHNIAKSLVVHIRRVNLDTSFGSTCGPSFSGLLVRLHLDNCLLWHVGS